MSTCHTILRVWGSLRWQSEPVSESSRRLRRECDRRTPPRRRSAVSSAGMLLSIPDSSCFSEWCSMEPGPSLAPPHTHRAGPRLAATCGRLPSVWLVAALGKRRQLLHCNLATRPTLAVALAVALHRRSWCGWCAAVCGVCDRIELHDSRDIQCACVPRRVA